MVLVGVRMLLPKTSGNMNRKPHSWTPCADFTSTPSMADSQHIANANAIRTRQPVTAASTLVCTRNPSRYPKPSVTRIEIRYLARSPGMAPARGAQRTIGSARNRSKTPVLLSWLSIMPVPNVAKTTESTRMRGSPCCRYLWVLPASAPPNTYVNKIRYMIGWSQSPKRSSGLVLIFSTDRQASVNEVATAVAGLGRRARAGTGAGEERVAVVTGRSCQVRGREHPARLFPLQLVFLLRRGDR